MLLQGCNQKESTFQINSPNDKIAVVIHNLEGKITYSLLSMGDTLVKPSEFSIFPDKSAKIMAVQNRSENSKWKPTWGQFSEFNDNYNELMLDVEYNQVKTKLYVRLYDQGVGLRYEIEDYKEEDQATFLCQYQLNSGQVIYSANREHEPLGPLELDEYKKAVMPNAKEAHNTVGEKLKIYIPIIVEQPNTPYLSLLESDLFSAKGFESMKIGYDEERGSLVSSHKTELEGGKLITPWRVILVNDKVGDLVVNPVTMNLAAPLALEDDSWVKPGITLWDWRVHGYTADDGFQYGITTESYKRFIDFQKEMGIGYFLIDDFWYKHVSKGHFELSDHLNLQEVIDYANDMGTDLLLYYDNRHGSYGNDELFPYYESLGMKGMKYGFMGDNAKFTRMAVQKGAESHLLMDFHDGPVPMTGIERTYPNAVSKEYCHAQQDRRAAFTPEAFVKMALINAIQGPLDMNNGAFDLTGINRGEREKGPREQGSYISTVTSEAARTLIIYAGLVCITDAPEAYMEKADLFEFIQKLPIGKWDESRVLNAKMGEYITTARSHNGEWFVGSVHDQKGGVLNIPLDFLKDGVTYDVTYYEDTDETHCVTNPEAYQVRTGTAKKGDIVKAKIAPGGGHCMWIRPSTNK
ncbi:alpha-glucosidase [Flagellimonas eckloniae]|uniref:Alpha-glucosidase n=2 Tax=Flagellimonas eckloniae TaxID=346185 RepID=A0A0Q0XLN5_9FLAO|nr:alpha-glucosidase [Allomuricauda eckloniae]